MRGGLFCSSSYARSQRGVFSFAKKKTHVVLQGLLDVLGGGVHGVSGLVAESGADRLLDGGLGLVDGGSDFVKGGVHFFFLVGARRWKDEEEEGGGGGGRRRSAKTV